MAADLLTRLRLLAHPVTTGALALLAVNDRILKPWAGGLEGPLDAPADVVTGKLSDGAGVLLVAVLAGVATGRRRAILAVGLAFVALKTSAEVAELAAPVLGGTTRTDGTDLLALATLPVADRVLRTTPLDEGPSGATVAARSLVRRSPGPVLTALVLVLTVPAVTATSCTEQQPLDTIGVGSDGDLYARIGRELTDADRAALGETTDGPSPTTSTAPIAGPGDEGADPDLSVDEWAVSGDLGRTWRRSSPPDDAVDLLATVPRTEVCTAGGPCYRVWRGTESGSGWVDEGRDGAWETAFTFSDEEVRRMELRADDCSSGADVGDGFRSVVVVQDVVLVPMGSQGLLRRDPSGDWERIGVGSARPLRIDGPSWFADLLSTPVALAVVAPALVVLGLARGHRALRALAGAAIALVGAAVLLAVVEVSDVSATDYADLGPGIALACVAVFLVSVAVAATPPPSWRRRPSTVTRPRSGGPPPPRGPGAGGG